MRAFLWLLLLTAMTVSARAHRVELSATVEEQGISGYGFYTGGARVKEGWLRVLAPDGGLLREIPVSERGEFHFPVEQRMDYRLVLETPDGHRAEWTVSAGEFPLEEAESWEVGVPLITESLGASDPEAIRQMIQEEIQPLRRELTALREDLKNQEAKIRWSDMVGGTGYLIGIAGILSLLLNKRRAEK